MPCVDESGDDVRADEARASRDQDQHGPAGRAERPLAGRRHRERQGFVSLCGLPASLFGRHVAMVSRANAAANPIIVATPLGQKM